MNKIDIKLKFKSGIYLIINLENGKRYIGSSKDIYDRLHTHCYNLKNNKGRNAHLQSAWNKYGENVFVWSVLEYCDENVRFEREQYYIEMIKPEYNLTTNVIANLGHTPTQDCKNKISKTLKQKYASGEIKTYRQDHNWKKCYVYDINNFQLNATYSCIADTSKALNVKIRSSKDITRGVINNKYVVSLKKLRTLIDIKNYVFERFTINKKWLISETNNQIIYHRSVNDCAKKYGISTSMIKKQANKINIPYIPTKVPHVKIYYTDNFVPLKDAVFVEESQILLSGKIGESPIQDNPEVNVEIKKSTSPYSVDDETNNRI